MSCEDEILVLTASPLRMYWGKDELEGRNAAEPVTVEADGAEPKPSKHPA